MAIAAILLTGTSADAMQAGRGESTRTASEDDLALAQLIVREFGVDSLLRRAHVAVTRAVEVDTVVPLNPWWLPEVHQDAAVSFVIPGAEVREWSTNERQLVPIRIDSSQTRGGTPRLGLLEIDPGRCREWAKREARCFNVVHWTFLPPQRNVSYADWWGVAWYTVILTPTPGGWWTLRAYYGEP